MTITHNTMLSFIIGAYLYLVFQDIILKRLNYKKADRNRLFCILFFLVCAFVMGCRGWNVGQDTLNYYKIFQAVKRDSINTLIYTNKYSMESSYLLLMKLFSSLNINYWGFQIFISFTFCGLSAYLIYKYCDDPIFVTAIFLGSGLYLMAFNIIRQMIAVCFFTLFYFALISKRNRKALFYAIIAFLMHKTSLIVISIAVVLLLSSKIKIFRITIPLIIFTLIPLFDSMFSTVALVMSDYANYLDNHKEIQTAGLSKIVWAIDSIIALITIYFSKKNTQTFFCLGIFTLFFVVFNIIGLQFNYAERMGSYFLFFVGFCYWAFETLIPSYKLISIIKAGAIVCYLIFYYVSLLTPQYNNYTFFF